MGVKLYAPLALPRKAPPLPSFTVEKLTLRRVKWEDCINLHLREKYWNEAMKISNGRHCYSVSGILVFILYYEIKTNIQGLKFVFIG